MKKRLALCLLILSSIQILFSQTKDNPIVIDIENLEEITSLNSFLPAPENGPKAVTKNVAMQKYQKIIENNSKALRSGRPTQAEFLKYTNTERYTFLGLAARANIRQDTIATLNGIENAQEDIKGRTLLLPTVNGLFIPIDKGQNAIEVLLQQNYDNLEIQGLTKRASYYKINERDFVFLEDFQFSPTERAYFLDSQLSLPIEAGSFWISSEFGKRKNPFSGQMKNHKGIDLAASEGTPVYAVKDGAVFSVVENDPEFGNYIILTHDLGKRTSVYAHLSQVKVEQYQNVRKGQLIGYVGQTGMATGPHLHFEIRTGGKAENPRSLLRFDDNKNE